MATRAGSTLPGSVVAPSSSLHASGGVQAALALLPGNIQLGPHWDGQALREIISQVTA